MASRQQSYVSRHSGNPDELSKILSEKFLNNEAKSVFVVGLPHSGKQDLARLLENEEALKKAFKIILLDSEKDCASTFRTLLEKLEEAGIKVDKERINRGFELDPSPNDYTKVSVYQGALKATLEKFSKEKHGKKLLVVIQGAEKIGSFIENEVFYDPPGNVAWMLISSSPIKSVISELGGSSYVAKNFGDKNTFYLKPFHGMPIESYCKQRNMEELQVWDELRNFLSELSAFARDGGRPSNFLEALRKKIVDNESIPQWINDALEKYGCFELFNNSTGRDLLGDKKTESKFPSVVVDVWEGRVTVNGELYEKVNSQEIALLCMVRGRAPGDCIKQLCDLREWYDENYEARGKPRKTDIQGVPTWVKQLDDRDKNDKHKRFSGDLKTQVGSDALENKNDLTDVLSALRKKVTGLENLLPPRRADMSVPDGCICLEGADCIKDDKLRDILGLEPLKSTKRSRK